MTLAGAGDFLELATAARTGNPILERIRDKGAEVVLAVYRLVKTALVHAIDNQAIAAAVQTMCRMLADFGAVVGGTVTLTYVSDTVFVCGQLLRASRATYESAIELGAILGRCGVSEVSFSGAVTTDAMLGFAGALATSARDPGRRGALLSATLAGIVVRKTDPSLDHDDRDAGADAGEKIVRLYATALAVMRRFLDTLASGSTLLPHRVKRLAQSLVSLSEAGHPAMVGMMTLAHAHRDDAGRAVQTALLSIVVARQITTARVPLARLAMTALLADAGRVRLTGMTGRDRLVTLSEDVQAEIPSATGAAFIAMAGVNLSNALRTVAALEATWLERVELCGAPYDGKLGPTLEARILEAVRALLDRVAPRSTAARMTPLDALCDLVRQPSLDVVVLRMVVRALGVIPTGTVIELESGEWAVVLGSSAVNAPLDRPRVRIVTDVMGQALAHPVDLDLGAAAAGGRRIARFLDATEARFNRMHALMG